MTPRFRHTLRRIWFPATLGLGLVVYELLFTWLLIYGEPAGTRWLGDTLQNSGDAAVYLAYIRQGSWLLANPFAVEPHALRFDLIWSSLSMIHAWTRLPPVLIHEAARWLATIALAFSIHAAARSVAKDEREARFASLLAAGGIGLGWLYSAAIGAANQWTLKTDGAPDIVSEFSVAPNLLGGAHLILSVALLLYVMRGIWDIHDDARRRIWPVMLAVLALTSFHPYFIPLVVAVIFVAWTKRLRDAAHHRGALARPLLLALSLLPSLAYYLWLFTDQFFRQHQLETNYLPLASWDRWIFVLLPSVLALAWIALQHDRRRLFLKNSRWCVAWLAAAAVLALFLPVPWSRKLTEGLMIPLVFITLPFWSALVGSLPRLARNLLMAGLIGAAPLHLFASQVAWLEYPEHARWFNRPAAVFRAWSFLETRPGAVIVSDDAWTNVWTPAWTGRRAWVGHNHETPDYKNKVAIWKELFTARERDSVRFTLQTIPVTDILLTSQASGKRMLEMTEGEGWDKVFEDGEVMVLEKK